MNAAPSHPSTAHPAPCAAERAAGAVRAAAWLQAVLVTWLVWAALLCIGLGSSVGAVPQQLAGKLVAHAQHLQRQAGTSAATRAARRDTPSAVVLHNSAAHAPVAFAAAPDGWAGHHRKAQPAGHLDGILPARAPPLSAAQPHTGGPAQTAAEPRRAPRDPAHPSRAPPALA